MRERDMDRTSPYHEEWRPRLSGVLVDSGLQMRCARSFKLANFDNDQGHVVSERAVAPRGRTIEDSLFHFGKC